MGKRCGPFAYSGWKCSKPEKEIIKLKAEVSQDGIDDVQVDLKVLYGDAWKTSQMLYYQNIRREGKKLW